MNIDNKAQLREYLNKFFDKDEQMTAVLNIRNLIMQKHAESEKLIVKFLEFVKENRELKELSSSQEEWKIIKIENERIVKTRKDIEAVKDIIDGIWGKKLLNAWLFSSDFSLYLVKLDMLNAMRTAAYRTRDSVKAKHQMKRAIQTWVNNFNFKDRRVYVLEPQFIDFTKMTEFETDSLKNFLLNMMKWERVEPEILKQKERTEYAKTIFSEFTQILSVMQKKSRSAQSQLKAMSSSSVYDLTEEILRQSATSFKAATSVSATTSLQSVTFTNMKEMSSTSITLTLKSFMSSSFIFKSDVNMSSNLSMFSSETRFSVIVSDVSMTSDTFKTSLSRTKTSRAAEHMNRTYSVFIIIISFTAINKIYSLRSKRVVEDVESESSAVQTQSVVSSTQSKMSSFIDLTNEDMNWLSIATNQDENTQIQLALNNDMKVSALTYEKVQREWLD